MLSSFLVRGEPSQLRVRDTIPVGEVLLTGLLPPHHT